jgi:hypothetical protein
LTQEHPTPRNDQNIALAVPGAVLPGGANVSYVWSETKANQFATINSDLGNYAIFCVAAGFSPPSRR